MDSTLLIEYFFRLNIAGKEEVISSYRERLYLSCLYPRDKCPDCMYTVSKVAERNGGMA